MKEKKDLPTLTDTDIVTNDENKKVVIPNPLKKNTMALALALTAATGTMMTSCSDGTDCDSNYTTYGDTYIANDSNPNDPYYYNDTNTGSYGDAKICD